MTTPKSTRTCLYCKGPLSDSPGAMHPTPEDYMSAMNALAEERAKNRALLDRAEAAESALAAERAARDADCEALRLWVDSAVDYGLGSHRSVVTAKIRLAQRAKDRKDPA